MPGLKTLRNSVTHNFFMNGSKQTETKKNRVYFKPFSFSKRWPIIPKRSVKKFFKKTRTQKTLKKH